MGEIISTLRKEKGMTQKELADELNITDKAVSKWEREETYPDITLLQPLSCFFGVTLDELMGYNREKIQAEIDEVLDQYIPNRHRKSGREIIVKAYHDYPEDVEECIDMLRTASEKFPNELQILLKLAQALHMWGWNKYGAKGHPSNSFGIIEDDIEYNSQNIYWQEAVRVYEKLLKCNLSSEDCKIAIRQITPLYCRMGEYEKVKALANAQNTLIIFKGCSAFFVAILSENIFVCAAYH